MNQSGDILDAVRLGVPMTLNNLAGGVAGGAAGWLWLYWHHSV